MQVAGAPYLLSTTVFWIVWPFDDVDFDSLIWSAHLVPHATQATSSQASLYPEILHSLTTRP